MAAQITYHLRRFGPGMMQERQEDLDDNLIGDPGREPCRLPGVEQRASALNLCLADRRIPMQIHVQLREALAFDLTPAQQRQQGVVDPYPNPLLQLFVGGAGLHLVNQTPHRLSQAAVHREMHIAHTP
jgi:hypothetical protein